MLNERGTPIKSTDYLLQNLFAPYRLEKSKHQIIIFKNPYNSPYNEFYLFSKQQFDKLDSNKQVVIKLLQDAHLEYWKCPAEVHHENFLVSNSYCLTAYYTDFIMTDLLHFETNVHLHESIQVSPSEAQMYFSISYPNVYYETVYEIIEKHIKYKGTTYSIRTFQPALYICTAQ